jgi:hypothetical protein
MNYFVADLKFHDWFLTYSGELAELVPKRVVLGFCSDDSAAKPEKNRFLN